MLEQKQQDLGAEREAMLEELERHKERIEKKALRRQEAQAQIVKPTPEELAKERGLEAYGTFSIAFEQKSNDEMAVKLSKIIHYVSLSLNLDPKDFKVTAGLPEEGLQTTMVKFLVQIKY